MPIEIAESRSVVKSLSTGLPGRIAAQWRSFNPAGYDKIFNITYAKNRSSDSHYLDSNAREGGGLKAQVIQELTKQEFTESEIRNEIAGELARSGQCLKTAAHFHGSETFDLYHHRLNCRKAWCEICGGKKGVISKSRKKAVRKRIDVKEYGLMQFVFTVPMQIRENLQSRKNLNRLFEDANQVSSKYFGDPLRVKRKSNGEVKSYSFGDKLANAYLHVFGDPDKKGNYRNGNAGTFHPHVNVHIFEKSENLFLSAETLEKMRHDWKIRLLKYGKFEGDVDIHFLYVKQSAKERKKYHKVKYMVKPYSKENMDQVIQDDNLDLLKLLTVDLKGFQFIRFWGGLSNVKKQYREGAGIFPDDIDEIEKRVEEKLVFDCITEWDLDSFLKGDEDRLKLGKIPRLKKIGENLYRERICHGKEN